MNHAPSWWRRAGTEPSNARSALGLRMLLSAIFAPLFAAATAGFIVAATATGATHRTLDSVLAGICAFLTLVAMLDLATVSVRRHREH
ncbi:DUF6343 family protein [Wenjunlia tyrosinilytica]|uniref:Uncharacterized protein n=1 Tax=Wenjunlia tyrosinilytica TaxID=1544741 RepID=A0A917ZUY6_9ACTN|nr:DUF6343 family protein [Wenjunlia tyrosinilytica]GGO95297.1 hypothetical protein GCM10012280_52160 [Wenjunlia tyrosinilytica]